MAEKLSLKYLTRDLWVSTKHMFLNMFKTCFSLHSSELLFRDSGELPSYKVRSLWSMVKRFLFPSARLGIRIIIYLEIIIFFFIVLGFFGETLNLLFRAREFGLLFVIFSFIGLFVFITAACGYARLRLPIEPFIYLLSLRFWINKIKSYFLYA